MDEIETLRERVKTLEAIVQYHRNTVRDKVQQSYIDRQNDTFKELNAKLKQEYEELNKKHDLLKYHKKEIRALTKALKLEEQSHAKSVRLHQKLEGQLRFQRDELSFKYDAALEQIETITQHNTALAKIINQT